MAAPARSLARSIAQAFPSDAYLFALSNSHTPRYNPGDKVKIYSGDVIVLFQQGPLVVAMSTQDAQDNIIFFCAHDIVSHASLSVIVHEICPDVMSLVLTSICQILLPDEMAVSTSAPFRNVILPRFMFLDQSEGRKIFKGLLNIRLMLVPQADIEFLNSIPPPVEPLSNPALSALRPFKQVVIPSLDTLQPVQQAVQQPVEPVHYIQQPVQPRFQQPVQHPVHDAGVETSQTESTGKRLAAEAATQRDLEECEAREVLREDWARCSDLAVADGGSAKRSRLIPAATKNTAGKPEAAERKAESEVGNARPKRRRPKEKVEKAVFKRKANAASNKAVERAAGRKRPNRFTPLTQAEKERVESALTNKLQVSRSHTDIVFYDKLMECVRSACHDVPAVTNLNDLALQKQIRKVMIKLGVPLVRTTTTQTCFRLCM